MKNTKIEWAHHTVNFWWGPDGVRWLRHQRAAEELMRLDASARKRGVRERVFVNSMSDTFENREDLDIARDLLWVVACCVPSVDILLLTKRPENIMRMVPEEWRLHWPANVWIGATVEHQAMADERIPTLLQVPATVRFLSCEPLLGPVTLSAWLNDCRCGTCDFCLTVADRPTANDIHWVICGGESGPKARPMHPDWARSLRDQCDAAGVPFLFKQWGEWSQARLMEREEAESGPPRRGYVFVQEDGEIITSEKVGKHVAGRLLDGKEHNAFPGGAA